MNTLSLNFKIELSAQNEHRLALHNVMELLIVMSFYRPWCETRTEEIWAIQENLPQRDMKDLAGNES